MDASAPVGPASRHGDLNRRWVIIGLLFASTFLNYFDRQTLSILKPVLKGEFGFDDNGYANIVSAFMITYVIAYTLAGRLVDRAGSRISLTLFVSVWSIANLLTGLAQTIGHLLACRAVLGAAEPGNYPAALRAATTWFPDRLRGIATSIYQSGSATAAVIAMPVVAYVAARWGWRTAFVLPGIVGLLWAVAWWRIYRAPSAEYAPHPPQGEPGRAPWSQLLRHPALWGIVLARLVSDQVWYFCLFWMPGYFQENLKLTLIAAGLIGWVPFLVADLSGIASGLVSDRLVRGGHTPRQARLRVLTLTALLAPCAMLIPFAPGVGVVIGLFCVVAAVCQIWLFNVTTLVADTFPRTSVASVLGVAGSFGALGGLFSSKLIGTFVGSVGYTPVFLALGCFHLLAAGILRYFLRFDPPPLSEGKTN